MQNLTTLILAVRLAKIHPVCVRESIGLLFPYLTLTELHDRMEPVGAH